MPKTDRQIDAEIRRRQRRAAYDAGRRGDDRERTARGQAHLYKAYDAGAAAAAEEDQRGEEESARRIAEEERAAAQAKQDKRAGRRAAVGNAWDSSSGFLSRGSWRPTLTPPSRARDAGGLLAGMLLYTAAITYIRYGPAGWTGWLKAKFLNRPMQGLPKGKGGPPTTVAGGAT